MTTKVLREKIFECQVRRRRLKADGSRGYESFWKIKTIREALDDGDQDFRCKDCHGSVKLSRKNLGTGPDPHAEHKSRVDSEYCSGGVYFSQATDGRSARLSATPVV